MDEIKLFNSTTERETYENLAALYAIVMSLEHLERAFARDSVSANEYTSECSKLLLQYKTVSQMVTEEVNLSSFVDKYKLNCPAAIRRLEVGIPSTIEHGGASNLSNNNVKQVAKTVQDFITIMDALNLEMTSVDKLHPLLTDLLQSINSASFLPSDYRWKSSFRDWLIKLNKMKASDELDMEQSRQLLFEVDQAFSDFKLILESHE
ncbi:Vacuolar protein-sorting-associated protein 28 [Coemansia erecta]|uniref:Vacuolar protein sorting-associated protein 28 n=1 Tax=Coemansia asiatica TaxID=1052880 RepID=A0A9W8CJX0_9FUNG|nr:Vacuolar protein-sorting-associated protein 28 [Coemansia asiatica]KAJ2841016.1 Vacuolar protein-sorting-associated protein 28 [Coemansia erecta]